MTLTGHPRLGVFMVLMLPILIEDPGTLALLLRRLPSGLLSLVALFIRLAFGVHTWNSFHL
jgi:hypothetical protein